MSRHPGTGQGQVGSQLAKPSTNPFVRWLWPDKPAEKAKPQRPDKFKSKLDEHAWEAYEKTGVYVNTVNYRFDVVSPHGESIARVLDAEGFTPDASDVRQVREVVDKIKPFHAEWEKYWCTEENRHRHYAEEDELSLKPAYVPRFHGNDEYHVWRHRVGNKWRMKISIACADATEPVRRVAEQVKAALVKFRDRELKDQIFAAAKAHGKSQQVCYFRPSDELLCAEHVLHLIDDHIRAPITTFSTSPVDNVLFGLPAIYIERTAKKK